MGQAPQGSSRRSSSADAGPTREGIVGGAVRASNQASTPLLPVGTPWRGGVVVAPKEKGAVVVPKSTMKAEPPPPPPLGKAGNQLPKLSRLVGADVLDAS